jgi:Uma2 family endonuclease
MNTAVTIPTNLADRLKMSPDVHRITGTYQEFVSLLEKVDYPIEYENGEIIIMSIASDDHEQIVANMLFILVGQFMGLKEYRQFGSNRHVFIKDLQKAYSPDVSVLKGASEEFEYAKGKSSYTNPWLVAEVISPSSRNRDFGEKLQGYKAIPSLHYILYVEQKRPFVTLFDRISDSDRWRSTDFNDLEQTLEIGHVNMPMRALYNNIV